MSSKEREEPMLCSDESRADDADEEATLRDVMFVSCVRGHKALHAREQPRRADREHRMRVWEEIGAYMNQPAEDCKKRWRLLRKNYYRTKKRAKSSVDEDEYWAERPALKKLMSLLDATHRPYIKTTAAPDSETDDSSFSDNVLDEEQHTFDFGDNDQGPSCSWQTPAPLLVPQEQLAYDDTIDFFVELGESMKDFPEGVKINAKREVFKIVIDAEEMLFNKKQKDELQAQLNICQEHE